MSRHHRRTLDDGRTLIAQALDEPDWEVWIEGDPQAVCVGWPLPAVIADVLGYNPAHDEWPEWIDRWAEEIASV